MENYLIAVLSTLTVAVGTVFIFYFSTRFLSFAQRKKREFNKKLFYILSVVLSISYMLLLFPFTPFFLVPAVMYAMFFCAYYFCYDGNLQQIFFLAGFSTFIVAAFRGIIYSVICVIGELEMPAVYASVNLHYMVSALANLLSLPLMHLIVRRFDTNRVSMLLHTEKTLKTMNIIGPILLFAMICDSWTMRMRGGSGYAAIFHLIVNAAFLLCFYVILRYFTITDAVEAARLRAYEQQLKLQLEHYSAQSECNENFKRLRHDYKAQLAGLRTLLDSGNLERARAFAGEMLGELNSPKNKMAVYSDNLLVDAIMQETAGKAEHLGIDFKARVCLHGTLPIRDIDVCTLFSNIMRNALEACSYVEPGKRFIRISSRIKDGTLAVQAENSYDGVIKRENGQWVTRKAQDAELHGIGLKRIREIVDSTEGGGVTIRANEEQKVFSVTLLMPLAEEKGENIIRIIA